MKLLLYNLKILTMEQWDIFLVSSFLFDAVAIDHNHNLTKDSQTTEFYHLPDWLDCSPKKANNMYIVRKKPFVI